MQRRDFIKTLAGAAALSMNSPARPAFASGLLNDAMPKQTGIAFNQVGYLPHVQKLASVRARGTSFTVLGVADGATLLQASLSPECTDEASGDQVKIADFSKVQRPGNYILRIDSGE
jgi:hypothetical protein